VLNAYTMQRANRDSDGAEIMRHAELVKRIAYHLVGRLPRRWKVADLIQAGMLGLLVAATHFTRTAARVLKLTPAFEFAARCWMHCASSIGHRIGASQGARAASAGAGDRGRSRREARDSEIAVRMGVSSMIYHKIVQDAAAADDELDRCGPDEESPCIARRMTVRSVRQIADECFRKALANRDRGVPERETHGDSLYYDDELNLKEIGAGC